MAADSQEVLAKLLEDLTEQCRLATRDAAEGRGDLREKLRMSLEMTMRAARAAAEKASGGPLGEKARALIAAHEAFERQTVNALTHLSELAQGWRCARCKATAPARAKLKRPPDVSRPVLECRACSADTPLTSEGQAAFDQLFGHLRKAPVWNPEANGFVLIA